jgi:plastocyanin
MGNWRWVMAVWVLGMGQSAWGAGETCQCCLSVLSSSGAMTIQGNQVFGPCGKPISTAKSLVTGVKKPLGSISQIGETAAASASPAPVIASASVNDNFFTPNPVTINVGDTVQWTWGSGNFHSVTSVAGSLESFDSGDQSVGTFSHTFLHAGTYVYYCDIHGFDFGNGTAGGMAATIKVNAVPEPVSLGLIVPVMMVLGRRRRR